MFSLTKTSEELKQAKADNANLLERFRGVEAELDQARKHIDKITAGNLELTKQLETIKADYEQKLAAANKATDEAKASANKIAAQTLASLGVAEGTIQENVAPVIPDEELYAQFIKLQGAERTEFYKAHRDAIRRASMQPNSALSSELHKI